LARTGQNPRTVLLAGLEPIFQLGIARALAEDGAEIVGSVPHGSDALVRRAEESAPRVIVLGSSSSPRLRSRLRKAAPAATLFLWGADAEMVGVLGPGCETPRLIPAPAPQQLSKELFGHSGEGETCPST
jgi:DNA-binding NarL/FixJ family response regulator